MGAVGAFVIWRYERRTPHDAPAWPDRLRAMRRPAIVLALSVVALALGVLAAGCSEGEVGATPNTILHRRVLVVLEEGAEAEVWEQYLSGGGEPTVLNTVVELKVGQNANLRYVNAQELNERSWIFGAERAEVDRDGALDWVVLGFGSARGKVRTETLLAGPGADAKVNEKILGIDGDE